MSIGTTCRDCVFATWDKSGVVQERCTLGRIERFLEVGTRVARETDDDGRSYLHIRDRICMACRHKDSDWAKDTPDELRRQKVMEDIRVRLHVFVEVDTEGELDGAVATAKSLCDQTTRPAAIHLLLNTTDVKPSRAIQALKDARVVTPFFVRQVISPYPRRGVDLALVELQPMQCNYYAVVQPGFVVPSSFVEELDRALNVRLEQFLLLEGDVVVVQSALHRMLRGNSPAEVDMPDGSTGSCNFVEDKINALVKGWSMTEVDDGTVASRVESDDNEHARRFVRKTSEVCPCICQ